LARKWDYVRVPVVPADVEHPRLQTTGPFSWIDREGGHDELCLFGGVSCHSLIEGPASTVREEVRYAIEHAARDGGLVIATSNVVQPGTTMENYSAMRQAVRDFGSYEKI
jgi:uroporphyrinogen-III decarboxylase|tara:strand:+ start:121 stop:450 length:330 start_codon:yes stop_codon:yes gene_type:complete